MAAARKVCAVVGGRLGLPARVLNGAVDGVPEMVSDSCSRRFVACGHPADLASEFIAVAMGGTRSPRSPTW